MNVSTPMNISSQCRSLVRPRAFVDSIPVPLHFNLPDYVTQTYFRSLLCLRHTSGDKCIGRKYVCVCRLVLFDSEFSVFLDCGQPLICSKVHVDKLLNCKTKPLVLECQTRSQFQRPLIRTSTKGHCP